MRDLGFDEIVGWSFTDPGEAGPAADRAETTRGPTGIVLSNPLSEDQSVMRTTLLGSLLDAARAQPRPRRRARRPLRVRPRLPATPPTGRKSTPSRRSARRPAGGRLRGRAGGAVPRAAPDRLRSRSGRWSRSPGGAAESRPTSSRSRASLEALAGQLGAELARRGRRPSRSCIPGAPRGSRSAASRRRLDRRAPPAGLPRVGPRGGGRLRSRPRRRWSPPPRAGEEIYEDVSPLPGRPPGPRRRRRRPRRRPPSVREAVLAAGGELLRSAEVFDLYEGEQVGEGRKSLALRLEFRRRRPHPHRRGGRRACAPRSRPRWGRSEGRSVADATRPAARRRARRAGARRRRLRLHRRARRPARLAPPEAGAGRGDLAQRGRQAARPALPALPGADRADRARPRLGSRTSTRRSSPTRTAPRRRPSPRCAGSASSSSTSPPTSGSATCRPTSAGTATHGAPELLEGAVYGLTELYRDAAARGRAGRDPGLLPDREPAGPGAARRARPARPRSSSRRCRAPRATGAAATTPSTSPR